MTYHDEVRDAMQDPSYSVRMRLGDGYLQALIDAIPPLTLKTEDGRFVKVERVFRRDGRERVYRIVEDPTQ